MERHAPLSYSFEPMKVRAPLALLALSVHLAACSGDDTPAGAKPDAGEGAGGAAGAANEGPSDTLFPADVVNEIEEGHYFLTGEDEGLIDVTLLLSFAEAMHVEMTIEGGEIDDVTGWLADDESQSFWFDFPSADRPEHDFSVGTYQVNFLTYDVDGNYRIDLYASRLSGSEL